MDFKLDKIGVYFYNSRGASVRFITPGVQYRGICEICVSLRVQGCVEHQ